MHITMPADRPRPDRATRQRAIGLVQGAAVGDALGAPFEFQQRSAFLECFPVPVLTGTGEMIGGGAFQWAPAEFTDDTQMALALAESLLENEAYDADATWRWFRSWALHAKDIGLTTSAALTHADWRDVPDAPSAPANGALMRAFPLALAFLDAPDETLESAVLHESALTHKHPAAGWGAWIAVELMRTALKGADPLAALPALIERTPVGVRDRFRHMLSPTWTPDTDDTSNGSVWGCLAQAVWSLRTTTSFEAAVTTAVCLGDDADTVACVTGALAGALYGVQAIPSRWVTFAHGSLHGPAGFRTYGAPDLQRLALRLIGIIDRDETPPEAPAGPVEVAPQLFAANLLGATYAPKDWAVISLCRTGDRFRNHPHRRQLFLLDEDATHNPGLALVVADAVDAIAAFIAEGRNVVVHCHGGRSRTGLVLKAYMMRTHGWTERRAHDWLSERWDRYADYNQSFFEQLLALEPTWCADTAGQEHHDPAGS